jgi:hypothetical protein
MIHASTALAAPRGARGGARASDATQQPNDAAVEAAAKARYDEGVRLYNKRRYEEARVAFLQASALKRRPAATLMLAQSALKAGRWLEAARTFDAYLAEVGGEVPPKLKNLVEGGIREARAHLGTLRFEVPEGAEVTVDGEPVASVDIPLEVMPGPHTVVIVHRDEKKTEIVEAVAARTVDVRPRLLPKALVPTADTRTRPTPPPPPVPEEERGTSILAPPATTWPFYAAGAIGLGGLAAAAIFGGLHANAAHAVEVSRQTLIREGKSPAECARGIAGPEGDPRRYDETCSTMARNERFARMHQEAFGISLLVGLAGTAVAAGWFLFAPKERAEPSARAHHVVPWIGLGAGGATFEGRF